MKGTNMSNIVDTYLEEPGFIRGIKRIIDPFNALKSSVMLQEIKSEGELIRDVWKEVGQEIHASII